MAVQYDRTSPVYDNTNVDNINQQSGPIDKLPSLSFDMPDSDIVRNLDYRIEDSRTYFEDAKGFDLKNVRNENTRYFLGKVDEKGLYRHQKPYKENQIFLGEESIAAYVTSQIAAPLVIPASDTARSKLFASDLEKAIKAHNEDVDDLAQIIELTVRNIRLKRLGVIKFYYDETYGDNGEVRSMAINPEHIVVDKNTPLGGNPEFICHFQKYTVERLFEMFPKKRKDIMRKLGMQRKTPKQMSQVIAVREVWVTWWKGNEPTEGCVYYFDDLVLDKYRNPNWLYASSNLNLLKYPKKPFIFGNLVNLGDHLIDDTTPVEQAIEQQKILNRRGRQIMENADKANGMLVISTDSGLTKDDAQNLTGDPNQKLVIATKGQAVNELVAQIQGKELPNYVINDKLDARVQTGNLLGAPTDFTGSQADDGDPTLGEVMVKKNQSAGLQDKMVRAITRMLGEYYEYKVQMFIVWYTESHNFVHDSGDGEFDYITLKRGLIEQGIRVKAGKPQNPDSTRTQAITLQLLKMKAISLLDAYKLLELDNPQQLYDNWAKQQADPMSLAREATDEVDVADAYIAYQDIMNGVKVKPKENPTKDYIVSLRKLMINDDFLKAPRAKQKKFIDYVEQCLDSLEAHLQLESAANASPQGLDPLTPLPPLTPPQPTSGMGAPMPPQGPAGPPAMGMPAPGTAPTPSSVFAGTPLPQPGQAPPLQPGNPASLPVV